MDAPGAVVSTSTKSDVLEASGAFRATWGRCFVFDPLGSVSLPWYAQALRWSPVTGCEHFEWAVATARSLASAARPGAALSEAAHWVERAEALLAPLLHAAALSDRNLADVMRWVLGHDLVEPGTILSTLAADMPRVILAGVVATEERERSGILSTAAGLLSAYRSEAALQAACAPNFDPIAFASSSDTVYFCAPAHAQEQLAPLIVTLIDQIRSAVYYRPRDAAPVVLALDEVAQIAPLPSLPAIAAEGGGQGLVTLACLQDLSQARARWGPAAEGFFSLFATKLVFPGLGDQRTLELISALAGEHQVLVRSVTRPHWSAVLGGRSSGASVTSSLAWRQVLPIDAVARGVPGTALRIRSDMPPHYVGIRPWWDTSTWLGAFTSAQERMA
jgi:type IV secretory pathway TraG/TraD family ATPase VirD4